METRANYLLIGAVTLAGIVAAFVFFIWYARIAIDRQYDFYVIRFDQVSGLSPAGDVRFNGILVGQVLTIDLSRTGTQVRVDIQVREGTPIELRHRRHPALAGRDRGVLRRAGERASRRGAAGGRSQHRLPGDRSEPSVIDSLIEGAPQLLKEATDLLRGLSGFVTPETQQRVTRDPRQRRDRLGRARAGDGGLLGDLGLGQAGGRPDLGVHRPARGPRHPGRHHAQERRRRPDQRHRHVRRRQGHAGLGDRRAGRGADHLPQRRYPDHRARAGARGQLRGRGALAGRHGRRPRDPRARR